MTRDELIAELQKMPENAVVYIEQDLYPYSTEYINVFNVRFQSATTRNVLGSDMRESVPARIVIT